MLLRQELLACFIHKRFYFLKAIEMVCTGELLRNIFTRERRVELRHNAVGNLLERPIAIWWFVRCWGKTMSNDLNFKQNIQNIFSGQWTDRERTAVSKTWSMSRRNLQNHVGLLAVSRQNATKLSISCTFLPQQSFSWKRRRGVQRKRRERKTFKHCLCLTSFLFVSNPNFV